MADETKDKTETGKNDEALRAEIDARWTACEAHYGEWDKAGKEDYAFALGDQWEDADRQALKAAGRPCFTFNRIRPILNLVSGYQRENSARIKVNPEGGEDKTFSEVCDKALHYIDKTSHLNYKLGYLFDDGTACGKGFIEALLLFDSDPIRGELRFKQRSPYQIRVDPGCTEYDMNEGAGYLFKIVKLSKRELLDLYPKKKDLINGFKTDTDDFETNGDGLIVEGDRDNYGARPNDTTVVKASSGTGAAGEESEFEGDQLFTVKEYWRKKYVIKYFVIDVETGEPKKFDKKEEAETFLTAHPYPDGAVKERSVAEMWCAAYICGHIVQDEISSFEPYYSGFPFFRYLSEWFPNAETEVLRVQGLVRQVKDPQREKNKAKSQYLHILNTQANSGWIGEEDALGETGWNDLKEMGSKPGIVVKIKKGFMDKLREILPKGPNQGHLIREEKADEEFKQILGINPDLMGFQEGTSSGRAISMRIKQAILSLVRMFENYRYTKEILGKFMLEVMPMIFDEKKLTKVLGIKYLQSVKDDAHPDGLKPGNIAGYLTMIKDNKYDVIVTEADQNSTIRYETLQNLLDMVKSGMQIPPDLLIDYMDMPNADDVKKKIQDYMQAQTAAIAAAKGGPGAQ